MSYLRTWTRRACLAAIAAAVGMGLALPASAQSDKPIRIGQTLALTGFLGQTGQVHKIVGEIFIENLNKAGGLLGRKVEWVLLDDQSKPDVARTLYERLITVDKVDLIMGPYATANILAAIGVAQRYHKMIIHNTMGIPSLATYDWQFNALLFGPNPDKSVPALVYDAYASVKPIKSVTFVTSKFPSAKYNTDGAREVAKERGIVVKDYMEYDFGTREYGSIAARVKAADADFLWMGALGVEGNLLLEAMNKLDYKPRNQLYLYPAPSIALIPSAEGALSQTNLENVEPFLSNPKIAAFAKQFHERAKAANLPYQEIDFAVRLRLSLLGDSDRRDQGDQEYRRQDAGHVAQDARHRQRPGQAQLPRQEQHQRSRGDTDPPDPGQEVRDRLAARQGDAGQVDRREIGGISGVFTSVPPPLRGRTAFPCRR